MKLKGSGVIIKGKHTFVIPTEEDATGKCQMCGKTEELRPYGPNGENVCFDCMMKDEEAAKRQFGKAFR